ncbi:MAG: hypothetical protein M3P53_09265 [Actinomycetota bacterium]|nr:hypothetical protein [Actinomycetota bacterium]
MVILALNWRVWAVLGLLFAYALVRRLFRSWRAKRRAGQGYASNRP